MEKKSFFSAVEKGFLCSGALVTHHHVLSAGHCFCPGFLDNCEKKVPSKFGKLKPP